LERGWCIVESYHKLKESFSGALKSCEKTSKAGNEEFPGYRESWMLCRKCAEASERATYRDTTKTVILKACEDAQGQLVL
jgi:hypothetical protein